MRKNLLCLLALLGSITARAYDIYDNGLFTAAVPCGDGTADLTFKVMNANPWEVEVSGSPEDIAGALTIPATVQNESGLEFAVKGIGESAFQDRYNLTSIVFPSTLTAIGHDAFRDCANLEILTSTAVRHTSSTSVSWVATAWRRCIFPTPSNSETAICPGHGTLSAGVRHSRRSSSRLLERNRQSTRHGGTQQPCLMIARPSKPLCCLH